MVKLMRNRGDYHSFLLRLWRVGDEGGWRVSLTRVADEKRLNFARLEDAMSFLEAQTRLSDEEEGDEWRKA
jgi:hypothetical protein